MKSYVDKLICGIREEMKHLEQVIDDKLIAHEKINETSAQALHEKLEQMNQFRQQIVSERSEYVLKEFMNDKLLIMDSERRDVGTRVAKLENSFIGFNNSISTFRWMLGGVMTLLMILIVLTGYVVSLHLVK